jgi:ribonuclease HII
VIAGVDEAGRGPLAGPVAAAAVILPDGLVLPGLTDSKALKEAERERLFALIMANATSIGLSLAPPEEITRLNIRGATLAAMRRALLALCVPPSLALIDGKDVPPGLPCPGRAIIKGDRTEPAISAASIIAKVMRDRLMVRLDGEAPDYGFFLHKGYPTETHRAAIRAKGATIHHRTSFAPFRNGT